MEFINKLSETLLYFVPAVLVLGSLYLMIKKYLDNDYKLRLLDAKRNVSKEMIPVRLQAYERMVLFLERINPSILIMRTSEPSMTADRLHAALIATIRAEYEHNFTQQLYMSPKVWDAIKNAKEETIKLINLSAAAVPDASPAQHLSKAIFDLMVKTERIPTQHALEALKAEARQIF